MSHYEMDLKEFKDHHFWEKFHKGFGLIGASLLPFFLGPYLYFAARRRLKQYLGLYLGAIVFSIMGITAGHGFYMVEERKKYKEEDSFSKGDPYTYCQHGGLIALLYGTSLWQTLNVVRGSQESKITNLNMLAPHNKMRGKLMLISIALTPILASGFCVAKIKGGTACNTFPHVGNKWFIDETHF